MISLLVSFYRLFTSQFIRFTVFFADMHFIVLKNNNRKTHYPWKLPQHEFLYTMVTHTISRKRRKRIWDKKYSVGCAARATTTLNLGSHVVKLEATAHCPDPDAQNAHKLIIRPQRSTRIPEPTYLEEINIPDNLK